MSSEAGLLSALALPHPVYVTRPRLPPLEDYAGLLREVWERRWLTNSGNLHQDLERRLCEYLGTPHLRLMSNGMTGLLIALLALERQRAGEVITTPFTFPATTHAIHLAGHAPVFCDLAPDSYNIDPDAVERAITPDTVAILAVHAFGTRCDPDAFAGIGARHGIPVIYDAAHTFGARYRGQALCSYGDAAILSFHATKLFTTAEGGAIVAHSAAAARRIEELRDFGIRDESTVVGPGFNGKMSELHAALGLVHLPGVDGEIARRREVARGYEAALSGVRGLRTLGLAEDPDWNCAYFPVRIDELAFGMSRDRVHAGLREMNVFARKYFAPLCSSIAPYDRLPSADPARLAHASCVAREVLCLPIFGELGAGPREAICEGIRRLAAIA